MEENTNTLPKETAFNISNHRKNNRPSSYYDNYGDCDDNDNKNVDNDLPIAIELRNMATIENGNDSNPTQEYLLNTTVPQNMAGINIAGKHTPTRNSLRHSRMIVMNRTGNGKVSLLFL